VGLIGAHALGDVLSRLHFQVKLKFGIKFAIHGVPAKQRPDAKNEFLMPAHGFLFKSWSQSLGRLRPHTAPSP
jgi:hypothetical protein